MGDFENILYYLLCRNRKVCYNSQMDRVAILLNPSSGRGRSLKKRRKIESSLKKYGIPFDLFISQNEDHLRQLARQAAAQYKRLVAVGGDTTYKIVAQELLAMPLPPSRKRPCLGMLGTGSANDIVRSLGTFDIDDLCRALAEDLTGWMRVGQITIDGDGEPDLFLGGVCLGLGTTVNLYLDSFNRKYPQLARTDLIGQGVAGFMAVRRSFREDAVPITATLSWNGESKPVTFSLLAFLNVPFFASGFLLVPGQSPFLKVLDAVVVDTRSVANTLGVVMAAAMGSHLTRKELEIITSGSFRLVALADQTMDIQVDGDVIREISGFSVTLLPEPLEVFTTVNVDHKNDSNI